MLREDSTSPTALQEVIFLTSVVDAKEEQDIMSTDIPNAFIPAKTPKANIENGDKRVIMKITGKLVDILIRIAPEVYSGYVVYENRQKVLYIKVLQALYSMLIAAMLWYRKFQGDLESIGFKFNPYDPCIANKIVRKKQQTICFHVDNIMTVSYTHLTLPTIYSV